MSGAELRVRLAKARRRFFVSRLRLLKQRARAFIAVKGGR